MADFLTKLVADLEEAARPSRKKPKVKSIVKFVDAIGSGIEGVTLTPEMARGHADEVRATNPLVKSVLENKRTSTAKIPERISGGYEALTKSFMNILDGGKNSNTIERLAFEVNPAVNNTYQSLYKRKLRLLPDDVLKRIALQDDLVAAIVNTRSQMLSAFGRPQPDRFSTGYKIEAEPGLVATLTSEQKEALQKQIDRAEAILLSCGQTKGWSDHDSVTFAQFLFQQGRNAVVFGRCATELIYTTTQSGDRQFHSFRAIDAGTIYRASPFRTQAETVRREALSRLESLKNKKLIPERYVSDDYVWVQVIEGRPLQAFTDEECVVHNFYPVTDIELEGYPITPLDTVIAAVTTHINITTHNKLYFQSGRAARGMLVFKTDDIDVEDVEAIKQEFNANINGVGNAWRMPVFRIGSTDEVSWQPIDNGSRDMEFQYLSDTNARVILSAFQMSPEELPGYAHLSRGTNNQALSESNSEYKLEAHRDIGIRPLLAQMQNYVNERIFPLIDPDLAKKASIKLVGLDADTAEKESTRFQQDMAVHMTMDEILDKVEKKPLGKEWGGRFPLNPQYQQVLYSSRYFGDILEHFFDQKGASQDPTLRFIKDPMWFQWQQMLLEQKQLEAQQQAQQAQPQQAQQQQAQQQQQDQGDLANSTDQLMQIMSKSEAQLPAGKRRLLLHQRKTIAQALDAFEAESKAVIDDVLADVKKLTKKP